ncbi:hypothetical protein ABIB17_003524 [Arthrobacter sp. UYEF6]
MANATEHPVGRSAGHEWAVFMATSGHFCWPPMGTNYWPLTEAVGGFPGEISWIAFVASQDEEDEQPVVDLQFYEAGADEANCTLSLNSSVLMELRSSLGAILSEFS